MPQVRSRAEEPVPQHLQRILDKLTAVQGRRVEDPDVVAWLRSDPRSFLDGVQLPVILNEIQSVPEILGYAGDGGAARSPATRRQPVPGHEPRRSSRHERSRARGDPAEREGPVPGPPVIHPWTEAGSPRESCGAASQQKE